jgi:pilus assembly protein CpaF
MSRGHPHIRICDAYGNRRQSVALSQDYLEIGSDPTRRGNSGFIHLESAGVTHRHAKLTRSANDNGWTITAIAQEGIKLGKRRIEANVPATLTHGEELWVGQNLLQLIELRKGITVFAKSPELSDLEIMMNEALLEFEDRRRDLFDDNEKRREELLSDELDQLLSDELDIGADPKKFATINRFCTEALRRPLISVCLMSGTPGELDTTFSTMTPDQEARALELREDLAAELDLGMVAATTAADLEIIHDRFPDAYAAIQPRIGETMKLALIRNAVRQKVLNLFFRLGPIQFLLDIPSITEIMVCGHDRIFVEKGNAMVETGLGFASESELFTVAARIAGRDGKQLTEGNPLADARLPDGSRVNIVANPTSLNGLALTIRKFGNGVLTIPMLRKGHTLSLPMERFLQASVVARKNIVISGGTGSGKTTLLNALSQFVPDEERIVTIEDTAELRLQNRNLVTLESRKANMDGRGEISIANLVKNALRMRPDRIVVGECRGGETLDMLQAMNTGHSGSMTTAHANSPSDLVLRLENMALHASKELPSRVIRQQIAAAVDLVVQVRKTASMDPNATQGAKQRAIVEIAELGDFDPDTGEIEVNQIFELSTVGRTPRFAISGYIPSFFDELADKGLIDISSFFDTGDDNDIAA